nr:siderophore-interacting protein [Kribbella speibonae]
MPKQIPMMVTVAGVRRLTPRMARVTVAGDELRGFRYDGPDQLARLFLPNASGELTLPVTDSWWPEMCAMPEAVRPVLRNYTVRRLDPEAAELDLDFVLHGSGEHAGPGSSWAENAQVGDKIGVLSDGADYQPPPDTTWQLLIADESALPAVAAILDQAPTGQHIIALLEVTDETDELPLSTSPDITVRWIHRGTGPPQQASPSSPPRTRPPRRHPIHLGSRRIHPSHHHPPPPRQTTRHPQRPHLLLRLLARRPGTLKDLRP